MSPARSDSIQKQQIVGRETVDSASGPASPVLTGTGVGSGAWVPA